MSVNTEVVIKTLIIIVMITLFSMQLSLGFLFKIGATDLHSLELHSFIAIVLLAAILVHVAFKIKKIKTLFREFSYVLRGKKAKLQGKADKFLEIFQGKTLEEFSLMFNLDKNEVEVFLLGNAISVLNEKSTMEEIALANNIDLFKLFSMTIKEFKS